MIEKETQAKIDNIIEIDFAIWWSQESEDIIDSYGVDEVNYNMIYDMCKTCWMNGAFVRARLIKGD